MSPHLVFATALFTIAFVVGCKSQRSSSMIFDAGPRPTVTSAGPVSLAPPLPPAPLPTLLVFESTEALIKKPWTRSLVERLARQTEIAGERVGIRGGPSVEYPLYVQARTATSRDEHVALLRHQSPVVRGYFGMYVAQKMPEAYTNLAPLLDDHTRVRTIFGCVSEEETVADVVLGALCHRRYTTLADPLLERVAKREDDSGKKARECLASEPIGSTHFVEGQLW